MMAMVISAPWTIDVCLHTQLKEDVDGYCAYV